jgi:CRISPR-associated protein Csd1
MLKKNQPGLYVRYDKLLTKITVEIENLSEKGANEQKSLNEDFILGYYHQKNEFYQKKDNLSNENKLNEEEV